MGALGPLKEGASTLNHRAIPPDPFTCFIYKRMHVCIYLSLPYDCLWCVYVGAGGFAMVYM